jgi:hypothetical protein
MYVEANIQDIRIAHYSFSQLIMQYVPLAFTPELGIFLHVTPVAFKGIIIAETPFAPSPPVRTAAMQ